jgi:hypothetical protein
MMKSNINIRDLITARKSLILRKIQFGLFAGLIIIAASCKKSSSDVVYKATLNGASETPPNSSTATGDATLTYNKDTRIFTIVVHFTGITATASHIHKAPVGVAGSVVFPFTPPITSPINYTSPALTASQDSALNANLYYVNVHSAIYPAGEIRGQLIKQ